MQHGSFIQQVDVATSKNQAPCSYSLTNHPFINATYSEFCFVMLLDSEF